MKAEKNPVFHNGKLKGEKKGWTVLPELWETWNTFHVGWRTTFNWNYNISFFLNCGYTVLLKGIVYSCIYLCQFSGMTDRQIESTLLGRKNILSEHLYWKAQSNCLSSQSHLSRIICFQVVHFMVFCVFATNIWTSTPNTVKYLST